MSFSIKIKNLSKNYAIYQKPSDRLKQMLFLGKIKFYQDFIALKDITLDIEHGSTVGIIGRNGAGKSTLLQIITGTLEPTSGSVEVNGKIGALLELGTGFNPEFTGIENIYLNGVILGLTKKEIDKKLKDILSFADIGDFANQPVKLYSSGMYIRLAFSVAVHINPDILIVDEALSVGDIRFQAKCFKKFEEFKKEQKTIIFVTHSPELIVRHCNRAVLLEKGSVLKDGKPKEIVNAYLDLLFGKDAKRAKAIETTKNQNNNYQADTLNNFLSDNSGQDVLKTRPGYNNGEYRWGNKEGEIIDCFCVSQSKENTNNCFANEQLDVYLKCKFNKSILTPIYALTITTPDGVTVYGNNSRDCQEANQFHPKNKGEITIVKFSLLPKLVTGHYFLSFGLVKQDEEVIPLDRRYDVLEIYITNLNKSFGLADLDMTFKLIATI